MAKQSRGALPAWQGLVTKAEVKLVPVCQLMDSQGKTVASIHNKLWDEISLIGTVSKQLGIEDLDGHAITSAAMSMAKAVLQDSKATHIVAKGLKILGGSPSASLAQKAKSFLDTHADDLEAVPAAFWQMLRQMKAYVGDATATGAPNRADVKMETADGSISNVVKTEGDTSGVASGGVHFQSTPVKAEPGIAVKLEEGSSSVPTKRRAFKRACSDLA